jgi:hypothetical protein
MPALSAFDRAWVAAEAACPLGWTLRGVVRGPREVDPAIHGKSWVAWAEPEEHRPDGPPVIEGKGESALQAVQNLANELRAIRPDPNGNN